MHVHIEGGGVLRNILPAACLYLFPSQLLFFCIYLQFIPSFFSSGSNNMILVGFCLEIFARARKKEAKCQILLTFHGLLLLINRRWRETNVQLVCFCCQDLEFGFLALLRLHQKWSKVVDMNTLTWAKQPEDVVPKVKWLSSIYGFLRGRVVVLQSGGSWNLSDVKVDFSALLCPDCSARAEPKLNPTDHTKTVRVEQHHPWTNRALFLKVLPEKNNLPLLNSHGGSVTVAHYWLCWRFNTISAAKKRTKVNHLSLSNGAVEKNCCQGLNNSPQILSGGWNHRFW